MDSLKIKVVEYYFNGKIKAKYTSQIVTNWMFDNYIEYFENGKIKVLGKYENNRKIGDWKWFKEDGSIEKTEKFRIYRHYYSNNIIMIEGGEYFDPETNQWTRNGLWIWYDENGKEQFSKEYNYGEEIENN